MAKGTACCRNSLVLISTYLLQRTFFKPEMWYFWFSDYQTCSLEIFFSSKT
jgi:hypothetical protein